MMKTTATSELSKLRVSLQTGKSVRLHHDILRKILLKEEIIKPCGKNYKVRKTTNCIELLKPLGCSSKKLLEVARESLPSITGVIITSTNQGLMTHHRALDLGLGGLVIAVILKKKKFIDHGLVQRGGSQLLQC